MNNADKFVSVFGITTPGNENELVAVVSNAVREGYAPVLCKPGDKIPLCTLNAREKKAADTEVREAARILGERNWERRKHGCGIEHALTIASLGGDEKKVRTKVAAMIKRLTKEYGGLPNLGLHLGLSRMLVVDMDTDAQKAAFNAEWVKQLIADEKVKTDRWPGVPSMTVKSPGFRDTAGTWVHKDGGHFWFTIPDDVELPTGQTALATDAGWVALWGGHQVLVPPSTRKEGVYEIIGGSHKAPDWLIAKILHETQARMDRVQNRGELPDGTGDIDAWSASVPWAELLLPDGWIDTGIPDRCSCPIFTAPGSHASPKSATAHDAGCAKYDTSPGHAPLHVWTDNPPDFVSEWIEKAHSRTLTKIQYLAARDYSGDVAEALVKLGFNYAPASFEDPDLWELPARVEIFNPDATEDPLSPVDHGPDATGQPEEDDAAERHTEASDADDLDEDSWKTIKLWELGTEEHPPTLLPRNDYDPENPGTGICLLYPSLMHAIIGENESGKSWLAQYEAVRLMKLKQKVLYLDFENDARQAVARFRALGATDEDLRYLDYRNPDRFPDKESIWWHGLFQNKYVYAVFDGVTDALSIFQKKSKDGDEVAWFYRKVVRRVARRCGAATVLIDHQVKDAGNRGRYATGAGYKIDGLDGPMYVCTPIDKIGRGLVGKVRIQVGKDKPGYVRGKSIGFDASRLSDIAVLIIDAIDDHNVKITLEPPADPLEVVAPEEVSIDPSLAVLVLRILEQSEPDGMTSKTKIWEAIGAGHRKQDVYQTIRELVEAELIMAGEEDGRGAALHRITIKGIQELAGQNRFPESGTGREPVD